MQNYIQATVTVLSLVNPAICAAIFSKITSGESGRARMVSATKAALVIVVILSLAALGGAQLLKAFGISLSAFKAAGGMVLVWMGFIMLRGDSSPTSSSDTADEPNSEPESPSLSPLILFAASPGTITGVITLSVTHAKDGIPVTALVAIIAGLLVTWLAMILAGRTGGNQKPSLFHDVASRFMGLIVLAMGVQFALSGVSEFLQH
ncbi:MarC family protein [Novipirellula aureliae]|nr:MarC family protein [Novipirellula aureliae]